MLKILQRPSPLAPGEFDPKQGEQVRQLLAEVQVLVIGAGGIGCELLKCLALSGFRKLHVIDMDTIDVSNLNRQFLFRPKDVGRSKALVAAEYIRKRVPSVSITPHFCRIQELDSDFYRQFALVICGLDSVEARRWINATLYQLYDPQDPASVIPLLDGGTEGFKGQSRVIIPGQTSCYECSLDMLTPKTAFPICTIANTPRLPEHCIEWASVLQWPKEFPSTKLDGDNPQHIQWLHDVALARAKEFQISGVTYSLTQGVVKNIIPAIASTNAILSASCGNEAFKMVTSAAQLLKTYMLYTGEDGVYTYTFEHERKPECPVCGAQTMVLRLPLGKAQQWTLQDFMDEELLQRPNIQLKKPSLRTAKQSLYMQAPPQLEQATRPNLQRSFASLVEHGEELVVTDASLPISLQIQVLYQ